MVATSHPQVIGLVPGNPEILRHIWIVRAYWATNGFTCPCPSIYIWTISQTRRSVETRWPNQITVQKSVVVHFPVGVFFFPERPRRVAKQFVSAQVISGCSEVKSIEGNPPKKTFFLLWALKSKNGNIIFFVFFERGETPGFFKVRFGLVMFFEIWTHVC